MAKKLIDLLRIAIPIKEDQKKILNQLSEYIDPGDVKEVRGLIKQKKAELILTSLDVSPQIMPDRIYPKINKHTDDKKIADYIQNLNKIVSDKVKDNAFSKFAEKASDLIPKLIALNIVGMGYIKKAASLQLFASYKDPIHILLLGDPGTGKTDILRSAASLHPCTSFGLGSGTSGVGLTVTVKGDQVSKGLLPKADKGICAIDELNLMQDRDRASLYNAMEKGFITYDKGGKHYKFDARVRIIATANPKGDRFAGWTLETLKQQMPFDSALLSRFHLVFLIRKPDVKQFVEISKKILRSSKKKTSVGDDAFVRDYVSHAESIEVEIPKEFEEDIIEFVSQIKANEKKYLVEVSPRLVLGFIRLAKASARMRLSKQVSKTDIDTVKEIVLKGLKIEK